MIRLENYFVNMHHFSRYISNIIPNSKSQKQHWLCAYKNILNSTNTINPWFLAKNSNFSKLTAT